MIGAVLEAAGATLMTLVPMEGKPMAPVMVLVVIAIVAFAFIYYYERQRDKRHPKRGMESERLAERQEMRRQRRS